LSVGDRCATEQQALALIAAEDFNAAMLDMNLNGIKSNAVADALSARGVPFVFAMGSSGQEIDAKNGHHALPNVGWQSHGRS